VTLLLAIYAFVISKQNFGKFAEKACEGLYQIPSCLHSYFPYNQGTRSLKNKVK